MPAVSKKRYAPVSDGEIKLESAEGKGASLQFLFPQVPAATEPEVNGDSKTVAGGTLLVEDEPSVRTIAARLLRASGYQVLEAEFPQRAMQETAPEAFCATMEE